MNKKVLRTMIILCWVFLVIYALLKCIPQLADKFIIVVNNDRLVKAGRFVDNHVWLQQIIYCFTTFLTYHFFLCACIKKWHLTWRQYIVLAVIVAITNTIKYFVPSLEVVINLTIMVLLPFLLKGDYRTFVIIFVTHYLGQLAISFIRGAEISLVDMNTLSTLLCCLDAYVWLLLYYLYSNLYKEKKFMGNAMPPLWHNGMNKQIEKEIAKIDKKIAKLQEKRAEYEKMLAETSNEK